MTCFDLLADKAFKVTPTERGWLLAASRARKDIKSQNDLTNARIGFVQTHGIVKPDKNSQGEAKHLPCRTIPRDLDTARRSKEEVLESFPSYSARLLLEFTLLTPLLTKDDDPFYLFDNPVRKDHIFGTPHIAAASLKGLSLDAYQRAFPSKNGVELLKEEQKKILERRHEYRQQDDHVKRLFGFEDDGSRAEDGSILEPSNVGRLHFSPIWFKEIQFLVMNRKKPETSTGDIPIQFEAIAPQKKCVLEVVYFNPNSDEQTVRNDLARWLAAVAEWWPALGLGAKRLAGYGAIQIENVTLQAVDWSGMKLDKRQQAQLNNNKATEKPLPPKYYEEYLIDGKPISEDAFEAKIKDELAKKDTEIAKLDEKWRKAQGKPKKKAEKALTKAKNQRKNVEQEEHGKYKNVIEYFAKYGQSATENEDTAKEVVVKKPIYERTEKGTDSWIKMAHWIAGEKT
jgi:CRISPR/Cas system CMR subunit Cmr6 (Cas7 group RAMP superfamily)